MATILPGTRLGRYEIHEYLGRGALGPIHRAYEPTVGPAAVELLTGLSPEASAELPHLAPRLVALRHPNVVSMLEFGEHEGTPYVVTEHVAGGALAQRLWNVPLTLDAVLRVLRGVAEGTDHAHLRGLVHGGLRPDRALLGADERPQVAELGLEALRWTGGSVPPDMTSDQAAYVAPEQAAGGGPTAAGDRYALAAMAYQLLTGRTPFTGRAPEVLDAHVNLQPPLPSQLSSRLGRATDEVMLRGLAKSPEVRFQTCVQFVEALREAVEQDVRLAARPRAGRGVWPWALAAAALLVLVALAAFLVSRANQPPSPGAGGSLPAVRAESSVAVAGVPAGRTGWIAVAGLPLGAVAG